ncbi:putative ABC transporter permease subunit, partial [Anaerobranca gottschalkii]
MNKTLLLTKVMLKNSLSAMFGMGKNKRYSFIMLAIVLISLAPLYIGLTRFLYVSFDYLAQIGQHGVIISLGIVVCGILIFFLGIFYIISLFYMADDIENLLPLPLKVSHILGANFFSVVTYEYITSTFFLLPVLIVYGIKGYPGILYFLYSIIVFLTLPIIPLSLASIISMVIMRFLNKGKNKDLLKLVGSLLAMAVVLGINFAFQRVSMRFTDMESIINLLIEGNNSLVNITNKMFPGLSFAASALIRSDNFTGFIHLLIYLAISIAAFIIFLILGELLYLKGVQGSWESISKKTELTAEQLSKSTRKNSPLKSYISKELKILFRTPAFLLNCVIINFLWPVFMAFPLLASGEGLKEIHTLGRAIAENNLEPLTIAIGLGIGIFIAATNSIVSTSISREGQNFYINKYIPVDYKRQILGKIIPGILLST